MYRKWLIEYNDGKLVIWAQTEAEAIDEFKRLYPERKLISINGTITKIGEIPPQLTGIFYF